VDAKEGEEEEDWMVWSGLECALFKADLLVRYEDASQNPTRDYGRVRPSCCMLLSEIVELLLIAGRSLRSRTLLQILVRNIFSVS
jgi:hypothetical protein